MAVVKTGARAVRISRPRYIFATPLAKGAAGGYEKGPTTYLFDHILRDSTSLAQDDNEVTTISNDLSDEAIMRNVVLGSWQFTTTVDDVQKDLVCDLCGFSLYGGRAYAPPSYSETFAEVTVVLDAGIDSSHRQKYVAYVIPKLQLNARMILESLNSSMAGFTLAGTAFPSEMAGGSSKKVYAPICLDYDYLLPSAGPVTLESGEPLLLESGEPLLLELNLLASKTA